VIHKDEQGVYHGTLGGAVVSVYDGGKAFMRRAIKGFGSPNARQVEWLVGELDGVRVYVKDGHVIVTKRDLYP
jgi:hypothetical protein